MFIKIFFMAGIIVLSYVTFGVVLFLIGVFITRWIFGIGKLIKALELQNEQGLMQIRMMKKILLLKGVPSKEIDDIMDNGNI